jgi:scyllo-inositol 2-dehydrogenase (NADP+)
MMIRAGIVGLGKMGLSHQSMVNAHPAIKLAAVCDTSSYMLDVLSKYTGVTTYSDFRKMMAEVPLDCLFVATPSKLHLDIVRTALDAGLHVFCEKPFGLDPRAGYELAELAEQKQLVNQVGYHYRYVGAFQEAKRLLDLGVIGDLHHLRIEAYGPVVLRPKGSTWRSQKEEGGGALFDYACHAIDLANYLVGRPLAVSGTVLNSVFSESVDDEIYSTFKFSDTFYGQLATNWSDDSFRKMSVKLSFWGRNGRINVDRQEIQVYLRKPHDTEPALKKGWNTRYTTDLTRPVWFYVRGEEYSAQIDQFAECIKNKGTPLSTFRTASDTVLVASMMRADALKAATPIAVGTAEGLPQATAAERSKPSFLRSLREKF